MGDLPCCKVFNIKEHSLIPKISSFFLKKGAIKLVATDGWNRDVIDNFSNFFFLEK